MTDLIAIDLPEDLAAAVAQDWGFPPAYAVQAGNFEIFAGLNAVKMALYFRLYDDDVAYEGPEGYAYDGALKWDGCMNWQTGGLAHFCGTEGLEGFRRALDAVGKLAIEHMPRYQGNFGREAAL